MKEKTTKKTLLTAIQSGDENIRTEAWLGAGAVGASVIKPLAKLVVKGELEVGRAAKRAMWQIVRTVGAPGTKDKKRRAVIDKLIALLEDKHPSAVRREVLWMLSEIGSEASDVDAIAALLSNSDLREHARSALQRIPGDKSLAALKGALDTAPEDFKTNIAQSLRARGMEVPGFPSQKLVPTKPRTISSTGR
ncbi:HEAT repeat domain-containing protein [Acidobacteria bacterium AH-259-A15]|nr:HEAT repeat domain-containing protein [Acidobacteria bacterium AH-259-A15]